MKAVLLGGSATAVVLLWWVLAGRPDPAAQAAAAQHHDAGRSAAASGAEAEAPDPLPVAPGQAESGDPRESQEADPMEWARWAADAVGLRLLGELTEERVARADSEVRASIESTLDGLAALASAAAEERARNEPRRISALVQKEAVLVELAQGRCAIVEDQLPKDVPADHEIYMMMSFETGAERRAALFLFPRDRYPQLAAARAFEQGLDLEQRRAHAAAFNQRSLEERKAELTAQLEAEQALSDLVLEFKNGTITRQELRERAARVPGTRRLPGFAIDRETWTLRVH